MFSIFVKWKCYFFLLNRMEFVREFREFETSIAVHESHISNEVSNHDVHNRCFLSLLHYANSFTRIFFVGVVTSLIKTRGSRSMIFWPFQRFHMEIGVGTYRRKTNTSLLSLVGHIPTSWNFLSIVLRDSFTKFVLVRELLFCFFEKKPQ